MIHKIGLILLLSINAQVSLNNEYEKPNFDVFDGIYSQDSIDLLFGQPYKKIYMKFYNSENDSIKDFYASIFITKAKVEKNQANILEGYFMKVNSLDDERVLFYADSIIVQSKENSNEYFPGYAYSVKANFLYQKRDFQRSLENALLSLKYAKQYNQNDRVLDLNHLIGLLKIRMQDYNSAKQIFFENYKYYKVENKGEYDLLPTIFAISTIYQEVNKLDSASYYNKIGFNNAKELGYYKDYFRLNEGVVRYMQNDLASASDSIDKALRTFISRQDLPNLAVSYYYKGKINQKNRSYHAMEQDLKRVDSIFVLNNDLHPKIRDTYETLIAYYKNKKDYVKQIKYIDKLFRLDSILHNNELYLNKNLIKKYDIPKLKIEREKLINQIKKTDRFNYGIYGIAILLMVILTALLVMQFRLQKKYKKRFNEILNDDNQIEDIEVDLNLDNKEINISKEICEDVCKKLQKFELNNEFIDNSLSLNSLALKFDTNSNYLSKIINHFKNKTFSNYIGELRINYIVELLKNEPKYRRYTVKAISELAGFNNAESFSKKFFSTKGIKPSYFIKNLDKTK